MPRKRRGPPPPEETPPVSGEEASPGPLDPLTDSERSFVELYFMSGCTERVESYMTAYPKCKNRASASVHACNMLQRPAVKAELRALKDSSRKRLNLSAGKVLKEYQRLSFSDLGMLEDSRTGTVKRLKDLHPDVRRALKSVTVVRERTVVKSKGGKPVPVVEQVVKYELWDKPSALAKLAKVTGIDKDENPLAVLLGQLPPELRGQVVAALAGKPATHSPAEQPK